MRCSSSRTPPRPPATPGTAAIDPALLAEQEGFTGAAQTGIALNAARRGTLKKKQNALANRMRDRAGRLPAVRP